MMDQMGGGMMRGMGLIGLLAIGCALVRRSGVGRLRRLEQGHANGWYRRVAAVHWHWGEGPLATHSRRSASVGTVGKHLISDSVPHPCRGRARSPEILAGNPCRNSLVCGNRAYEAFPYVHPCPIRVSVPLLLRPPVPQIGAAYLSSHQSSRRLLSKMLSTIIVGPLT
jgi:hypothetical protein